MRKILILMIILMGFFTVSCGEDTKKDDTEDKNPCENITCGEFGKCEELNNTASCKCDTGYHTDGLNCVKDTVVTDPCKDITCGDNGDCLAIAEQATCNCSTGYHAEGLNCVKDDAIDPCADITCGDFGNCKAVNDRPTCDCDEGYEEIQLLCKEIVVDFDYKTIVGGTTENEAGISVSIDDDDNRWIVGEFSNTLDLGCGNTLTSTNDSNAFVAKLDRSGKCLKLLQLESSEVVEPNKILVDGQNVYVLGSFMGKLTLGGTELISKGEADILLIKIDTDGNYVSSKTFGSLDDDYGYGLFVDNGNVYISGSFRGDLNFGNGINKTPNGEEDLFITKLNSSLVTQWVYSVGSFSGNEVVNDLVVKSGFVYAVGEFSGQTDFDDGIGKDKKTPVGKDGFILKLDDNGVYQWSRQIGGDLDDYISQIVIDSNDNLFAGGSFIDIIDADWGEEAAQEDIIMADGHHDIFITKLDVDGNYINTKQFIGIGDTEGHKGDDFIRSMVLDANNKLHIVGVFSDLLSFNPANENDDLRMTEGDYDIFLAVLNDGVYDYAVTIGSDLDDYANSVDIDSTGMVVITGAWQNTANFSPISTPDEKESKGKRDLFLWNYKK